MRGLIAAANRLRQRLDPRFLGLLSGRVLQLLNGFAISVALVWCYGLPAAGAYALASVPAAVASLLCGLGLGNALPRLALTNGERATIGLLATVGTFPVLAAVSIGYGALQGESTRDAIIIAGFAWGGGVLGQLNVLQCLYVLQKRTAWAPLAPAIHLLGIVAAMWAPDLLGFVAIVTCGRLIGCVVGFMPLQFERTSWRNARTAVIEGFRFVPLDLAATLSELLPLSLMPLFLTRPEIGLFGLARQFVTVADTPGWSYVQANYPAMVADLRGLGAEVARRNDHLAWSAAAGSGVVAAVMAVGVYHVPQLIAVLPLVLLPMPARYANNFCDQALRAAGWVGDCARLTGAKIALSMGLYLGLASLGGFWGAVIASALLSWGGGFLYRWRVSVRFPSLLPSFRPWRFA